MASNQIVEKKTKGQQKIELKRIEDEKSLSVTFSKRRKGLFSKAAALSAVCGAEVAIMVVSPGGRVYAFGSPNVHTVVQRYLSGGHAPPPGQPHNYYYDVIGNLHAQLRHVVAQVQAEKKRAAELRRKRDELEAKCWMAAPYHTHSRTQLLQVKARLQEMSKELTRHLDINAFSAINDRAHCQFYGGHASSSSNPVPLPLPQVIPPPPPPMMPSMPRSMVNQNVAFSGNMMGPAPQAIPRPPPQELPPPLLMMPLMPQLVTNQNVAYGGNMAHAPNYGGWCNDMGGYGGSSSSNPVALPPPQTISRLSMPMSRPVVDQNVAHSGNMMGPPPYDGWNNMRGYGGPAVRFY